MIDLASITWRRDKRIVDPEYYTIPPDDPKNRLTTFLGGWQEYLENAKSSVEPITWKNLGRVFASVLGDIPDEQRRGVYAILLHIYANGPKTKRWSEADRAQALKHFTEAQGSD